ncbi:MAG: hypothetical protein CVV64_15925 [Candidatus Wallbacteria bacterium HGW-Wallbacteria-1]|jgi:spore coat polysaccharide biosynthesis predicted glycosyltransferase SpsG|uniref:Glycosyl transferase family 28 C-terminal domain-containing protein n=1 Tax=Candidatus Wallbacteria bacterium HGW-Wallbacteria-1 TaxID=2013854 RepID=A0A2N1PL82_9BACT|nr:MAG: hypothetical protein CVV64_15925 [Candidatus Wallbacteria bacterium HGW-Wallbacteria-1]
MTSSDHSIEIAMIFHWGVNAGFGHGRRCSILSGALRRLGCRVAAVSSFTPPLPKSLASSFDELIQTCDFTADSIASCLENRPFSAVILDGYNFDEDIQKTVLEMGFQLIRIDDPPLKTNLAPLLLLPATNRLFSPPQFPEGSIDSPEIIDFPQCCLAETDTAIIGKMENENSENNNREERNSVARNSEIKIRGKKNRGKKILVSLGSASPVKILADLARGFLKASVEGYDLIIVPGPLSDYNSDPKTLCGTTVSENLSDLPEFDESAGRVFIIPQTQNLAALMRSCDLMISSAGVTLQEALLMAIPVLSGITADNQKGIHDYLMSKNAVTPCHCSGNLDEMYLEAWAELFSHLPGCEVQNKLHDASKRGAALLENSGPQGTATKIIAHISENCKM